MPEFSLPHSVIERYLAVAPERWLRIAIKMEQLQGEDSIVGSRISLCATWDGHKPEFRSTSLLPASERYSNDLDIAAVLPDEWSTAIFAISVDGPVTATYETAPLEEADYITRDPFQDYLRDQERELTALGERWYGRGSAS